MVVGKGFLSCTEQDSISCDIKSPDMSGKDNFALNCEMKEKVLFPFCMGDLSDLLLLCVLSPHAPVYSAIQPFSSSLFSLQTTAV